MYFVWDVWSLIEERDEDGDLIQKYVNSLSIDEIIVKIDINGSLYNNQDGLGSTLALSDAVGDVAESYQYVAFGSAQVFNSSLVLQPSSLAGNRFLFTGREWIVEVELYDYRNRFYSPEFGRFLQMDPIRVKAGDVNLYQYGSNSVILFVDPFGLEWVESNHRFDTGQGWIVVHHWAKGIGLGSGSFWVTGVGFTARARVTVTCTCSSTGASKDVSGSREYSDSVDFNNTGEEFGVGYNNPTPAVSIPNTTNLLGELLGKVVGEAIPKVLSIDEGNQFKLQELANQNLPTSPTAGSWKGKYPCE